MKKILSLALLVSAFSVVPTVAEDEKNRLKASLKS
jgi:hypothetical protein